MKDILPAIEQIAKTGTRYLLSSTKLPILRFTKASEKAPIVNNEKDNINIVFEEIFSPITPIDNLPIKSPRAKPAIDNPAI